MNIYAVMKSSIHDYAVFLNALSTEEKRRISSILRNNDSEKAILSRLFVRYILSAETGIHMKLLEFGATCFRKPYLHNKPELHFNLSHSGEWIVMATDEQPIGIDIEEILPIDMGICEGVFTDIERADLRRIVDEAVRLRYFYDLWTLKESYIKADGRGLSIPLKSITIRKQNESISFDSVMKSGKPCFCQYDIDDKYITSVCAWENRFPDSVNVIDINDISRGIEL